MVGRALVVIKKARDDPIADYPIRFRPFDNLHLELLENKKKLKKGLPLVPLVPLVRKKPPTSTAPSTTAVATTSAAIAAVAKKVAKEKVSETPKEEKPAKKEDIKKKDPPAKKKVEEEHSDAPSDAPSDGGSEGSVADDGDMVDALATGTDGEGSQPPSEEDVAKKLGEGTGSAANSNAGSAANSEEDEGSHAEEEGDEEKKEAEGEEEDEYAGLTPEEKEAKQKEEYMWRFRILKKKYKTAKIPEFNEHSDLQTMKTTYERTVKELYLDESVDSYRNYLIGGFVFTEFICTQWIGIDMKGFTKQQAMVMHKYESLLVELGERSYNRWNMNLPVEVRLIGFILLQAAIFYVGKKIAEKAGNSIGELFKGVTGQPPTAASSTASGTGTGSEAEPKQTKMRGPSLSPSDIKNMKQD